MKKLLTSMVGLAALMGVTTFDMQAQRISQPLGRGVVATTRDNSSLISWRRLAQDPEQCQWNVYTRGSASQSWTKLNAQPLKASNFQTSALAGGTQIAVKAVVDGVESGDYSAPFTFVTPTYGNQFFKIDFVGGGSPLDYTKFYCKFVWPVDLDGDGEYDYVVDRKRTVFSWTSIDYTGADSEGRGGVGTDKLEGYLSDGTYLWTIDLGPNVFEGQGQNDLVTVGDFDCDGRGEVAFMGADGTCFWDQANHKWGAWLEGRKDIDGDGIVDYVTRNGNENAQYYIVVADGMTGVQKYAHKMDYAKEVTDKYNSYTRSNKKSYLADEYSYIMGAMGTAYLDGIHPSVVMQYCVRENTHGHHYYTSAYSLYDHSGASQSFGCLWTFPFYTYEPRPEEYHGLRIGDVDGDGRDEVLNGAMCVDDDGSMLYDTRIGHGDRFRLSDIDPNRPGQEMYAIQQSSLLGQLIYDAGTGKHLKEWYLGSIADIGRGECMDVLPQYKGYEFWSLMPNVYTAQGDVAIEGNYKEAGFPYPYEGMWWDGDLARESMSSPGGSGRSTNMMISKFDGTRLAQFSRESDWKIFGESAVRAMFWGDIYGDWREEAILHETIDGCNTALYGFTTNIPTSVTNIYCLQQDPAYRGQCTNRGYYQSPMTGFYLGFDMSTPPLPPFLVARNVWSATGTVWQNGGAGFVDMSRTQAQTYADGQNVLFGLDGHRSVEIPSALRPDTVFMVVPRESVDDSSVNYDFHGAGSLAVTSLWKTGEGRVAISVPLQATDSVYVSEGIFESTSTIDAPVSLRAKGTIAGTPTLKGDLVVEGALNYAGGRLRPGTDAEPYGTITLSKSLRAAHLLYIEADINSDGSMSDKVVVNGDVTMGDTTMVFNLQLREGSLVGGIYPLLTFTGKFEGDTTRLLVMGLDGYAAHMTERDHSLCVVVKEGRQASTEVVWTGAESNLWDYNAENFSINGTPTTFVNGDQVTVNDETQQTTINFSDLVPMAGVSFENNLKAITVGATNRGGFSGEGGITKRGVGDLYLTTNKHTYTGKTLLQGGTVYVAELAPLGSPSSLGAGSNVADDITLQDVTFVSQHSQGSTDRKITIRDTVVIDEAASRLLSLNGVISGTGTLIKRGAGQLTVSEASTFTGGFVLDGGTVSEGLQNAHLGPVGGSWTVKQGSYVQYDTKSTGSAPTFNYQVSIPDSLDVFNYYAGSRAFLRAKFTGKGTLNYYSTYVRGDFMADMSEFEGVLATRTNSDAETRLCQGLTMRKGIFAPGNSAVKGYKSGAATEVAYTNYVGSIAGNGSVLNGTWNIGYDNRDFRLDAVFESGTALHKYGTGTMLVSVPQKSMIHVHEGVAAFANSSKEKSPGSFTAYAGSTIEARSGYVTRLTMTDATLRFGTWGTASKSVVKTYVTTNLVLTDTRIAVRVNSVGCDQMEIVGATTLTNPTIQLCLHGNKTAWEKGDTVKVFLPQHAFKCTGVPVIECEALPEGLVWDVSTFASDGVLRLVDANDPSSLQRVFSGQSSADDEWFTLDGRRVQEPLPGRMYIRRGKKVLYGE